jgi:hypothetical protein
MLPFSPAVLTEPVEVPIVRFSAEGVIVDTVGSYLYRAPPQPQWIQVGRGEYILPQAADSEPQVLVLADGTISIERPIAEVGQGGVFVVTRRDFSGETLYRQTFTYEPVAYPDSILQHRAGLSSRPGSGEISFSPTGALIRRPDRLPEDSARAHAALLREMEFPPFLPPISGTSGRGPIFVGEDGTLWLRREDGRTNEGLDRWLGLNPDGSPIGSSTCSPRRRSSGVKRERCGPSSATISRSPGS